MQGVPVQQAQIEGLNQPQTFRENIGTAGTQNQHELIQILQRQNFPQKAIAVPELQQSTVLASNAPPQALLPSLQMTLQDNIIGQACHQPLPGHL